MENKFYNELWETEWKDMNKYGPFHRHLRRMLISELSKVSFESVLDVGCGSGSFLIDIHMKYPNAKLAGLDLSESAKDIAQSRLPDGSFYIMDISQKSLEEEFDLVICSEVLEHIEDDNSAIHNLARMTNKYLLVSTPQGRMRNFEKSGVGHVRNYSKGELISKLSHHNLEALNLIEWGFPFYSPLYRNFLELVGVSGTKGKFGNGRKLLSKFLYILFSFNSSKRGDELIVLAQIKHDRSSKIYESKV